MTRFPQVRLIYNASESDNKMLWATQFLAPAPFIFIEKHGKRFPIMSELEMDGTKEPSGVDTVFSCSEYVRQLQRKGTMTLQRCMGSLLEWSERFWTTYLLQKQHVKIWFESLRFLKSGMLANILPHSLRGSY